MKTLIIGATGFIGKHLVKKLKKKQVRCLVRKKSKKKDIDFLNKYGVELFYGDLKNPESLEGIDKNVEEVYYLAGGGKVASLSEKDYEKLYKYNVKTLENFLKAIKKIKKIVFFSSVSAIGIHPGKTIDEKTKENPLIPHEKCKLEAEKILKKYSKKKNYNFSIIRPSIVYGEHCFGDSYDMIKMINKGFFLMPGNGKNKTPWIYVKNVVNATVLLMKKGENQKYIINHKEKLSFNKIIKFAGRKLNKKILIFHIPLFIVRPATFMLEKLYLLFGKSPFINMYRLTSMTTDRIYSIEKIENLGYKEEVNFRRGMEKTIRWYKKNGYL